MIQCKLSSNKFLAEPLTVRSSGWKNMSCWQGPICWILCYTKSWWELYITWLTGFSFASINDMKRLLPKLMLSFCWLNLFIGTAWLPHKSIVRLSAETYDEGVWSAFSTNSGRILYFVLLSLTSERYSLLHASCNPLGTGGQVVMPVQRLNSIHL